jgi:hypothetical protein
MSTIISEYVLLRVAHDGPKVLHAHILTYEALHIMLQFWDLVEKMDVYLGWLGLHL